MNASWRNDSRARTTETEYSLSGDSLYIKGSHPQCSISSKPETIDEVDTQLYMVISDLLTENYDGLAKEVIQFNSYNET